MTDLSNAASITPPVSGSDDIVVLASATSAAAFEIPNEWLRGWITIDPEGCDCFLAFSRNSALALDETAVTTLSSNAISAHGTGECVKAKQDVGKSYDLAKLPETRGSNGKWYLIHKESTTGGYIRIQPSSGYANR